MVYIKRSGKTNTSNKVWLYVNPTMEKAWNLVRIPMYGLNGKATSRSRANLKMPNKKERILKQTTKNTTSE